MNKIIALILLATAGWSAPTVTPSTATVQTTKTIQFSSTDTVTWSLVPGSLGSISAGGLYTAPSTIQNRNVAYGCPVVPDSHIYNSDITGLPVAADSTNRVNNVGAVNHDYEISFPPNVYGTSDVTASTMTFYYTSTQNGATYYFLPDPYRGVETNLRPNDYFAQDRHILGVNSDTCEIQEVYNFYPRGTNIPQSCPNCNAQSGVKYGPMSYQLAAYDGSTDAAGLYVLPLAIRLDEMRAGVINHALRFTLSNGYNYSGFLWPGTNFSPQCGTIGTCFPYGSRLRLKASYDDSALSTKARVITQAMKKYGMFMADGGLTGNIQAMTDVVADTATWNVLMSELPGSTLDFTDFEQVDESSLMISSDTGRIKYPNAYGTYGSNYAIVIATKNSDSTAAYVHIAIQGVNVGVKNVPFPADHGVISVMAGTPQFTIPYVVTGSTQTTATCSMTPTLGTLSSDCLYTAPSSVVKFSSAIVTVTAVADSTAPYSFPLVVYSSSGIRVDTGWKATAQITSPVIPYDSQDNYGPDVNGNYWSANMPGSFMNWYARDDGSYPQVDWRVPQPSDIGLHYSGMHGTSDGFFGSYAPNGTYLLKLLFGSEDTNLSANSVMQIESQNQILMSSSSFVTFIGTSAYTAKTSTHSVTVSDNNFYFALRFPDNNSKFTQLSGFELKLESLAESQSTVKRFIGRAILRGRGILK